MLKSPQMLQGRDLHPATVAVFSYRHAYFESINREATTLSINRWPDGCHHVDNSTRKEHVRREFAL